MSSLELRTSMPFAFLARLEGPLEIPIDPLQGLLEGMSVNVLQKRMKRLQVREELRLIKEPRQDLAVAPKSSAVLDPPIEDKPAGRERRLELPLLRSRGLESELEGFSHASGPRGTARGDEVRRGSSPHVSLMLYCPHKRINRKEGAPDRRGSSPAACGASILSGVPGQIVEQETKYADDQEHLHQAAQQLRAQCRIRSRRGHDCRGHG